MRAWVLALVALLVAGGEEIGQGYGKQLWRKLTGADKDPVVEEVRQTAARINNGKFPGMLDSATRVDAAHVGTDNKQLILVHTLVLWRATEITEQQLQDALAAKLKASACGTAHPGITPQGGPDGHLSVQQQRRDVRR